MGVILPHLPRLRLDCRRKRKPPHPTNLHADCKTGLFYKKTMVFFSKKGRFFAIFPPLSLCFDILCLTNIFWHGIIYAECLAAQVFGLRPMCASHTCAIDGFAKKPLQASFFASWYNILNSSYKSCAFVLYDLFVLKTETIDQKGRVADESRKRTAGKG